MKVVTVSVFDNYTKQQELAKQLRYLYKGVLTTIVTILRPRWILETTANLPEADAKLLIDDLMGQTHRISGEELLITTPDSDVGCNLHFGYYDPERDAVILGLEPRVLGGYEITLNDLFDAGEMPNDDQIRHYLVLYLSQLSVGYVVLSEDDTMQGRPEDLAPAQLEAIFVEAERFAARTNSA